MTPVTDASTAIGDLRRFLTSGSIASTVLELLGVALIANGLRLLYPPAMWVFVGVACFATSYVVEATDRTARTHGTTSQELTTSNENDTSPHTQESTSHDDDDDAGGTGPGY
jgi:hypothetical protein